MAKGMATPKEDVERERLRMKVPLLVNWEAAPPLLAMAPAVAV